MDYVLSLSYGKDSLACLGAITVHDFDERFQLEDEGFITADEPFRWSMLEDGGVNYRWF